MTAVTTAIAAIAALWFSSASLRATRDQYGLSQQVAVTDRLQKAVEQLASDKVDARIAGVYLLERLAKDSPTDHIVIFGILTSFLRTHASESYCSPAASGANRKALPDIQAALTVIGRRLAVGEPDDIDIAGTCLMNGRLSGNFTSADISETNLSEAVLRDANLERSRLNRSNLSGAGMLGVNLQFASLRGANLTRANLGCAIIEDTRLNCANLRNTDFGCDYDTNLAPTCVNLSEAILTGADLSHSRLSGANLSRAQFNCIIDTVKNRTCANLVGASLDNANLTGALLRGVDMTNAYLQGADMTGARLEGANLANIFYDNMTRWPYGFTPPPSRPEFFPN